MRIGLGTIAKLRLNFTAEGKEIGADKIADFTAQFFVSPSRKLVINKSEMIAEDGGYIVFVDTAEIGIGKLQYNMVLEVLDPQYPEAYRKEVTTYSTDIEIYK